MKKKWVQFLSAAMAVVVLSTGCGGASKSDSFDMVSNSSTVTVDGSPSYGKEMVEEGYFDDAETSFGTGAKDVAADNGADGIQLPANRKLIRNVSMNVETKEYEDLLSQLNTQIAQAGGYIENLDSYNGSRYQNKKAVRSANLTIRIPSAKVDSFLANVTDLCNVTNRTENVEDVTLTYVDMESRRASLRIEQERLTELLQRAETLEDIFTIENRMTEVRYQLESMESRLRAMKDQVDYSTVKISILEVQELTPVELEEKTRWQEICEGFIESAQDVLEDFLDFVVWFLINIPKLLVWAVLITIAVIIVKALKRRKAKKAALKARRNENTTQISSVQNMDASESHYIDNTDKK